MTMSLIDGGIRGKAIKITIAVNVVHPDALGALDDDVERMIVVGSVVVFEFDELGGLQVFHDWHKVPRISK